MLTTGSDKPRPSAPPPGAPALVLCLLLLSLSAAAGKLYRWVDEDGNVHYTDTMPADATDEAHRVMDERGTVMDERDSTRVERQKRRELEARRAEERRREMEREERRRRDRIIMQTFTTERDIELTRKDRIDAVQVQINIVEHGIKRLRDERRRIELRLRSLPEDSRAGREHRKRLEEIDGRLEERWAEKFRLETRRAEIDERFDDYLRRFRELKPYAR